MQIVFTQLCAQFNSLKLFNVSGIKRCSTQVVNAETSQNSWCNWQTHSLCQWIKRKSNACQKFMSHKRQNNQGLPSENPVCLLLKLFVLIVTRSYMRNFMTNVKKMCPSHTIFHMPLSKPCVFTCNPWATCSLPGCVMLPATTLVNYIL